VGGVHVVGVGSGVTELVGDDDGFVIVGCLDAGSNIVAGGEGLEEVGNLVAEAAHRQSPNREFHFIGSSTGQLQRQSAAEAHEPLHEPSYIE
jgi:hypothetical protein